MPPPSPSTSLFLFHRFVRTDPNTTSDIPFQGPVLTSQDKQAVGFEEKQDEADSIVRDFVLAADLKGLPLFSSLFLGGGSRYTCIHTVDKDLILIASDFPGDNSVEVILIYNAIDRSLRMIPTMPRTYPSISSPIVLVARQDDEDSSYTLVYPGTDAEGDAVLYMWPSSSKSPWSTVKKSHFCMPWRRFRAGEVFSFRGRGYWVDLFVGIMYCDCGDLISDVIDRVDIRTLDLPVECPVEIEFQKKVFRAIGPVGDSIKFVDINDYRDRKNCMVRVWRLLADMTWALEYELRFQSLLAGGQFKGDAVPDFMNPMHPFLSPHEDHVIYFAVGTYDILPVPFAMLRVDLCSKTFNRTELLSPMAHYSLGVHVPLYTNTEGRLLGLTA
ncbi:uncharacterized protein [Lolium perenne]|jgi:hypothetical protein|uniref:uncharacterized protein n=1 Tax=Lolium perenne TaxID=4522 RepID=UPI0021EA3ED1|nr:uncharacterized protein LOC127293076 [Lolium perenne]